MTTTRVEPPSGIVTFVFTDIEGSTRLFHRLGDRYIDLLERHNAILRGVWSIHGGYEVTTDGDAFLAAFADAGSAVRACADGQRQLAAESWPDEVTVRVRMGVHTGLASPHDGDYVALAVHQASRVVAASHGGVVLLSEATVDALGSDDQVHIEPLGRYRLRDFDDPLALYRLAGPGLADTFPALRAVPADGHNIVKPPTPTIGRDELIAEIGDHIEAGRPLTLIGPGGVGKTRIAAEVGMRIAPDWTDGVWLVDLAGVSDPELVGSAVAEAVGAPTSPGRERWDDVLESMASKRATVILDNAEHVRDTCRELVQSLEEACPGVAVLAGSRLPLHVPGEVQWPVEPLEVVDKSPLDAEAVLASPAGRLFAQRGAAVRPGFVVDNDNAADVAEIVHHVDGLPLSIELAAAHLAVQSPAEINAGLEEAPHLLSSRDPHRPERHRSIEDLLTWSYESLSDDERTAFRALSVFGTGFSIETAVPAVASAGIDSDEVAALVWALVARSLAMADLSANETRYRLLETMRSYGHRLLEEARETDSVATGLAEALMELMGPWLITDRPWIGRVATELDNLRTLVGLLSDSGVELAQQIGCTIGRYHDAVQTFRDGVDELERYVVVLPELTPTRVSLLSTLAYLHLRLGDVDSARGLANDASALRDELGVPEWDDVGVDRTLGELARRAGDLDGALAIARNALERPLSDRGRSRMYNLLGTTSAAVGDMETAYDACNEELHLNEAVGYYGTIASAHGNLAEIALRLGDINSAAHHQAACLDLAVAQGSTTMVAFSLIVAARIAGERDDWATAARLHAQGEVLLEQTGLALYEDDLMQSEKLLDGARAALGQPEFEALTQEGRGLRVPEAVEFARTVLAPARTATDE